MREHQDVRRVRRDVEGTELRRVEHRRPGADVVRALDRDNSCGGVRRVDVRDPATSLAVAGPFVQVIFSSTPSEAGLAGSQVFGKLRFAGCAPFVTSQTWSLP